jgi:hypothetical protein
MIESLFIVFDPSASFTDKVRGYFRWIFIGVPAVVGWWALWKSVQFAITPDAYGHREWFEIAVSGAWIVANAVITTLVVIRWRRLDRWEFVLENMTRPQVEAVPQVKHDYFLHAGFDDRGNDLGTHRIESVTDVEQLKAQMVDEAQQLAPPERLAYWQRVEKEYRKGGEGEKQIKLFALNRQKSARSKIKQLQEGDSPSPTVEFNQ